jgi:hypothetical protein
MGDENDILDNLMEKQKEKGDKEIQDGEESPEDTEE